MMSDSGEGAPERRGRRAALDCTVQDLAKARGERGAHIGFANASSIRARAMIAVRSSPGVWMAMAFCASLGLPIGVLAFFGNEQRGVNVALQATARLAFLFFWPAYVGGALIFLFGDLFLPIRRHVRELGLAFAAALLVHLGLVVRLCAIGSPPSPKTFGIFGLAAGFVYLLAVLSVDRLRQALPSESWQILRTVAMTYIAFAFVLDFKRIPLGDLSHSVAYVPFAALSIVVPLLRLAVWAQILRRKLRIPM
jgi:hypothetical protein